MNIQALITSNNITIIDPTVSINADAINCYRLQVNFQQAWDNDLILYAIFKPKLDTPIYIALDNSNSCMIPSQIYHRFSKLGIGIKGVKTDASGTIIKQCISNLFYIPIKKSAGGFVEDLL